MAVFKIKETAIVVSANLEFIDILVWKRFVCWFIFVFSCYISTNLLFLHIEIR